MDRRASALDRGVLGGLAGFRALAWVWMATVLVVSRSELSRPGPAVALCALAFVVTVGLGIASRVAPDLLLRPGAVVVEVATAAALLVADGWVYGGFHRQSLGSAWPIAAALAAGVVTGPIGGAVAGTIIGAGRWGGTHLDQLGSPGVLSLLSTAFLYALAGGAAGLVMARLRGAQDEIAAVRAREDIARTLHDGVLQTLAVVQRRSTDEELAELARTQERELRQFLFGIDRPRGDLLAELRHAAGRAEARHGLTVQLTVVEAPGPLPPATVEATAAAVGEALTNAAKHGGATRAVVFVEPDDADDRALFVTVNDDGCGFDAETVEEGVGLGRSIRGRITDVGGRVEVATAPGRGTEIRLWIPS